jgi:hypothetical protein
LSASGIRQQWLVGHEGKVTSQGKRIKLFGQVSHWMMPEA